MKLSELITDPATGRLSESKLWLHPGKAAFIWAFIHITLSGQLTSDLLAVFGVLLFAHETVSRLVSWRFSKGLVEAKA